MDEIQQEPGPQDERRVSWAAYFGAASGLLLGALVGMLGASILDSYFPGTEYAEMFWEITGPILAIAGFVVVGMAFHRWFMGQVLAPAVIFFLLFFLSAYLAYGPLRTNWLGL